MQGDKSMISFGVIGASVRGGSMQLLEALTVPSDRRAEALVGLKDACGFAELTPVFTCNRVEFYYIAGQDPAGTVYRNKLLDFFLRGRDKLSFGPSDIYCYSAFRALKHLYRVSASLDSMVVGEAQILGQVKDALVEARSLELIGPRLEAIFAEAFRVAKKIRRETPLGEHAVSMATLVAGTVDEHLAKWGPATVAIVGVGPMAIKLAEHLRAHDGLKIVFVNRTVAKAQALAGQFAGRAMSLDEFFAQPPEADIIFSSTSSPDTLFDREKVDRIRWERNSLSPLLLIDLAIPRDVDPAVGTLPNILLRDIPWFQTTADTNRRARFVAVDQAEQIVELEIARAHRENAERQFKPVFASTLNEALAYARTGLDKLFTTRLDHLTAEDRAAIGYWAEKLVRYTNQLPVSALAEQADTSRGDCAMIAGYGCMQTRPIAQVATDDPTANRCAQKQGRACILDGHVDEPACGAGTQTQ
jgi:glutamyl-tRNA reductase